jgi:hypothetical protein
MEPKQMSWWVCQQCGQWVDDFLHGCKDAQVAQAEVTASGGTIYVIDGKLWVVEGKQVLSLEKPDPETPPRPRRAFDDNTGWKNAWAYCVEVRKKSRLFDKEGWGDWSLAFWAPPYAFKTREACDRRRAEFERTALYPGEAEFRTQPRYFSYDVTEMTWYREDWVTILPCRA